ncbi:hypothetical protein SO802_001072 [Lithocarpus litseifolius]|uniref:Pentatricopeptide repeat-containing protein n=1 Tax=Lithocarpus litseifolius TaxID=425828 RepID=A0AAW2DWQ3_9ROSI
MGIARKGGLRMQLSFLGRWESIGVVRILCPDEITFVLSMDACFKADRADDAAGYYRKMVESGLRPNLGVYNKLVDGLVKVGKVDDAKSFFDLMVKKLKIDVASYEFIMKALSEKTEAKAKEAEAAEAAKRSARAAVASLLPSKLFGNKDGETESAEANTNLIEATSMNEEVLRPGENASVNADGESTKEAATNSVNSGGIEAKEDVQRISGFNGCRGRTDVCTVGVPLAFFLFRLFDGLEHGSPICVYVEVQQRIASFSLNDRKMYFAINFTLPKFAYWKISSEYESVQSIAFDIWSLNEDTEVATKEVSGSVPPSATTVVEVEGASFWQWVQVSGGCSLWKIVSGFCLLDEELGQSDIGVAIYETVRGKKKSVEP